MKVYFNENDRFAAAWLGNLFPQAKIDQRSILDVQAEDVVQYHRAHFFGGIGGWEYALHLAGWPEDFPVWTGSCPCQPFSCAGKGEGEKDERHLWPELRRLIEKCLPPVCFGEQVASKDGREWLSRVRSDLEALGYAVGCADLCAPGASAPHLRQRLFWVADSRSPECRRRDQSRWKHRREVHAPNGCGPVGLADSNGWRPYGWKDTTKPQKAKDSMQAEANGDSGFPVALGDSFSKGLERHSRNGDNGHQPGWINTEPNGSVATASPTRPWDRFATVYCSDGKTRRFEHESFPLATGVSNRVGKLRGYGNAICPQIAAVFITAFMESEF